MDVAAGLVDFQRDRGQRLRRRSAEHPRALGGVVDALLRAAVNDLGTRVDLLVGVLEADGFVPVVDEADALRRMAHLVRADGAECDHRAIRTAAALPQVARAGLGGQRRRGRGGLAQIQQEAGRGRVGVVEDVALSDTHVVDGDRGALWVDQQNALVALDRTDRLGEHLRIRPYRGRCARAQLDEAPSFHRRYLPSCPECRCDGRPAVSD